MDSETWRLIGQMEGEIRALARQIESLQREMIRHDDRTARRITAWSTTLFAGMFAVAGIIYQMDSAESEEFKTLHRDLATLSRKVVAIESRSRDLQVADGSVAHD